MPHAECRERDRKRRREHEQRTPGDDRGRTSSLRRERRDEQQARADESADVERRAADHAEATRLLRVRGHRAVTTLASRTNIPR
jgi:hypothetical protein